MQTLNNYINESIVKKAIEKKVISNVPFEIMRHVLETRIIVLEELYYKITTEFGKEFGGELDSLIES